MLRLRRNRILSLGRAVVWRRHACRPGRHDRAACCSPRRRRRYTRYVAQGVDWVEEPAGPVDVPTIGVNPPGNLSLLLAYWLSPS